MDATPDTTRPRVVIVGGGFAGLNAARSLANAEADVVLIDKQNYHLFQPLLYQVATASLSPGNIASPLRQVLAEQANCSVIMAEVTGVDVDAQTVAIGDDQYCYDYLVLAAGTLTNYFGNDQWVEHAPGLKTIEEGIDIRGRILVALERAEVEADPEARQRDLTFAIVGAGPTGVELAGALSEIRTSLSKDFRRIDIRHMRIVLLDFADRVLPTFADDLSRRARRDLEHLGVEVLLQSKVVRIDDGGLSYQTKDGKECRIESSNVVWAAGVKASPLGNSTGVECDRAGRVLVQDDLSIPGYKNVFVAGDLAHCNDPETGEPVPGVAQGAIQMGRFIGKLITAELSAQRAGTPLPQRSRFKYDDKGSMAIIGRNRAVAQIGEKHFGGFFAFVLWAFVHILFLIGFRRKLFVFAEWGWLYFTHTRGVRLITGKGRQSQPEKPPSDARLAKPIA